MSGRASLGWQTALADLALILFMITAAAASRQSANGLAHEGKDVSRRAPAPSPQAEPLAVYVDTPGAPPLAEWLSQQAVDPRQQLTVTAHYGAEPEGQSRALAAAARLVHEAGKVGRAARIVVEPGEGPTRVVIAFDTPESPAVRDAPRSARAGSLPEGVARSLL